MEQPLNPVKKQNTTSVFNTETSEHFNRFRDIRIINFSVAWEEILSIIPQGIMPREFNGRALISLINATKQEDYNLPQKTHNIAVFRLLIDDRKWSGDYKGVYILNEIIKNKESILSSHSKINGQGALHKSELNTSVIQVFTEKGFLEYTLSDTHVIEKNPEIKLTLENIDRAFGMNENDLALLYKHSHAPKLKWIKCNYFQTNIFKTAQLESAFLVCEHIGFQKLLAQLQASSISIE